MGKSSRKILLGFVFLVGVLTDSYFYIQPHVDNYWN